MIVFTQTEPTMLLKMCVLVDDGGILVIFLLMV